MKLKHLSIIGIVLLGAFLRFYKLDWGSGLFTHPDEYHIITAINQLSFPDQMNPHFFSYGTVTIYLIYLTQELLKYLSTIFNLKSLIFNLFLIGRFYSALFSTFTIIIAYKICRFFMQFRFACLASLLIAIMPGLIQQAHFATPESTLTFFMFVCIFLLINFLKKMKLKYLMLASVFLGLAMGVKISSIVLLLPLILSLFIYLYPEKMSFKLPTLFMKKILKKLPALLAITAISMIITMLTLAIVSPFIFLDFLDFKSSLNYEGGLAMGKFLAFYTRQFIDTVPVIFQLKKILPYALGPFLLLFSLAGIAFIAIKLIKKPRSDIFIFTTAFLAIFIINSFLFAKWTRFIAPAFPFFAIFPAYLLYKLYFKNKFLTKIFSFILIFGTLFWTIAFFSIYLRSDVRITSSNWIEKNLPTSSIILLEGGNMIDVPTQGNFNRISLDFYNIETDSKKRSEIASGLSNADYFIIQSRRVFMNHQRLPDLFPKTANLYNSLFNGSLGFTKIKEFNSYPQIQLGKFLIEFPDEEAEETWSVFDHPVIRVFKKTRQLSLDDYAKYLEI